MPYEVNFQIKSEKTSKYQKTKAMESALAPWHHEGMENFFWHSGKVFTMSDGVPDVLWWCCRENKLACQSRQFEVFSWKGWNESIRASVLIARKERDLFSLVMPAHDVKPLQKEIEITHLFVCSSWILARYRLVCVFCAFDVDGTSRCRGPYGW